MAEKPTQKVQILGKVFDALLKFNGVKAGQHIKVAAVDENGAPTAFAADDEIQTIKDDIADLKYKPIDITSVSNDTGTKEMGTSVAAVKVSWAVNKQPKEQSVNGTAVAVGDRSAVISGPFTSNHTFTVRATDERGATDSASTAITFLNGVYYGVLKDGQPIDSAAILKLTKKLKETKDITFTANADAGYRHAFALPAEGYGTPTFKDAETGFQAGFYLAETFEFTNRSGHTETYNVWLSTQIGLGSMTVVVS